MARLGWLCWGVCGRVGVCVGGGIQLSPSCPWCRLTSVTDDLAVATKEVLSRQEMVSQLQSQLRNEEQSTHPRER